MQPQGHTAAWAMPKAYFSSALFGRNTGLLVLTLSFAIQCLAALQNPRDNFCRRYGHQSTVIDDKLYIDGGWVNFDTFAQDHTDYPSKWYRLATGSELT
jgi:hypothetical protein